MNRSFPDQKEARPPSRQRAREERWALWLQLALHLALVASFVTAGYTLWKYWDTMAIQHSQKVMFQAGIGLAIVFFSARGHGLWRRLRRGGPGTS